MSKRKSNKSLSIISILFLTTLGFQELNSVLALTLSRGEKEFGIEKTRQSTSELINSEINLNSSRGQTLSYNQDKSNSIKLDSNSFTVAKNSAVFSEQDVISTKNRLLSQNPENFEVNNEEANPVLKLVRQVSLFFFLLFFIPFGLFYPFFLFYKNLLDLNDEDRLAEPTFDSSVTTPVSLVGEEPEEKYSDKATFSQLQIAFSPEAKQLKQQLKQISSSINQKSDRRMIEFMRQTVSVLNTQQYWTHCSYSYIYASTEEIQAKFALVVSAEKNKCMKRGISRIDNNLQTQTSNKSNVSNPYQYTVVTLIFSTLDNSVWFEQINTKEELAKKLRKLSKMPQDNLLNFKLIWNPQQEGEFISNHRLLMDYEDMVRLF